MMNNSWHNHNQQGQQSGQVRFFDPSQFQPPISDPATLKYNQPAAPPNSTANNAFQPPQKPSMQQAWGGAAGNAAPSSLQDTHSSWNSWGSWDWNQDQNAAGANQQEHDSQQQYYQQQQIPPPHQPQSLSTENTQLQNMGVQPQYEGQAVNNTTSNDPHPDALNYNNVQQYSPWDTSGQYANPNHSVQGHQEMQYNHPYNPSYYREHYSQNQYGGNAEVSEQAQQQQQHKENANVDHQDVNTQSNSVSLDQGQSQVLYDQPSVSQNDYNPSNFPTNDDWFGSHQNPQPQYLQHEAPVQSGSSAGGVDNADNRGTEASQSVESALEGVANTSQGVPSIMAEPSLNDYCDNDSDGGTVAGFFGRGDDDGDVSSDAQRSSRFNSMMPGAEAPGHGQFLEAGKPIVRENSEISNASMSTLNMSVDDEGKEHLDDLQALVQRMESVDLANRQAAENKRHAEHPDSMPMEYQQPHGDYSGFGNDAQAANPPPPSLSLDTNADRSSPDVRVPASSESGGSGGSGGSSGLTDWEIVPSQMGPSRNSSPDNSVNAFSDKPDGSITKPLTDSQDGGTNDNLHHNQISQSFNAPSEGVDFHNSSQAPPTTESSSQRHVDTLPPSCEQLPPQVNLLAASSNSVPLPSIPHSSAAHASSFQPHPSRNPLLASNLPSNNQELPPQKDALMHPASSFDPSTQKDSKSMPQQSLRLKMRSDDGVRPTSTREPDSKISSDKQFKKPRDPLKKEPEGKVSLSSQRRHQSAFHPVHKPRTTTVSPALWETDSGSSSNILLAPAMPLIIPALNPYSSSAAATATTETSSTASVSKTVSAVSEKEKSVSKELEDQTPRSRYGDRKGERDRGRDGRSREKERVQEDANRSMDSLDELDTPPDIRSRDNKPYRSDRPGSRTDRYQYDDRPSSRTDRPLSRSDAYSRDDPYRRSKGYYADSYYDEHYDRPRSRHEEGRSSRPSSRSAQESDRPKSRGDYDRDREHGYRDRNRGYNYDSYSRNGDYYDERDRYYRYYRDRDARYSRGYYEEYYGSNADYYGRGSRPDSRQDYARDYYNRGYGQYDYSGYYDGYGYYPYAYGYTGYEDPAANQGYGQGRMTPPKYSYAHVRACFGPKGQLVKVLPNNPADGQPGVVELMDVQTVLETCQEAEDLKQFPGPLTREGTHKKDVLYFCQQKARECMQDVDMMDRESAQLVWRLLELLIKQNGSVIGTDLSDLLLEGHEPGITQYMSGRRVSYQSNDGREPSTEDSLEGDGSSRNSPALVRTSMDRTLITPSRQRESCISRFRQLLLYGRKKDAIECAIKNNLWGHAFFLASKMDTRTHASVMIRFANSAMRLNDPLQTLYQLMSGRQPASVTCVLDERWGDWRPHLAMILSNQTSRQDLDRKSITTLGDTLAAKGCLHASHFCYLMAQVPFGTYDKKTSKIVLIGSNPLLPLKEFASVDAIQCTEVYEYSQVLNNPAYCLPHFQLYKYLYACRLVDYGMASEALMYCEVISTAICNYPTYFQSSFAHLVYELASKLKYADPQRQNSHVDNNEDPAWMQQLLGLLSQYNDGTIQTVSGTITPADLRSSASGAADVSQYQQASNAGAIQSMGEAEVQSSASTGFDAQTMQQYSQQPGYGDYSGQTQFYQDTTGQDPQQQQAFDPAQQQQQQQFDPAQQQQQQQFDPVQQQQQFDTTQQQQHQQQPQYPNYSSSGVQQGYQQQDYTQWQQQQQQYAGYQYTDYGFNSHHHSQQPEHQPSDVQESGSNSSASTFAPPPSMARPSLDSGSVAEDPGHQTDLASSMGSSDFSAASHGMPGGGVPAMMPPRASVSTNETEDDDDDDADDDVDGVEGGGGFTGFDYFGNPGAQKVVAPPHRYRTTSESSSTGTARRRRTTSGSSTGSVKASPHKPAPSTQQKQPSLGTDEGSGKGSASSGGWFGGLFSKFGRKGKNEMILPDDKDPAIVWDPDKNKWVNADGTEDEVTKAAPPPKDTELLSGMGSSSRDLPPSGPGGMGPPPPAAGPPGANKFSLQAKGVRNKYVDLNNPKPVSVPQGLFNVGPPVSGANVTTPQFFVPGSTPTNTNSNNMDTDASNLLSAPASSSGNELSRSSSMSSVSQEVQLITGQTLGDVASTSNHQPPATSSQPAPPPSNAMPLLFNPASLGGSAPQVAPAGSGLKYGQRRAYPKK